MSWGVRGESETLEGASGRTWTLRFERRLAPRETADVVNPASTVWLVRDEKSARLYAAKRQNLASLIEVDALVDEAAAWRASCLADSEKHVIELEDVFVSREAPFAVIFLAEFCSRGLLPKRLTLSEPVLLTIVADLSKAAAVMPSPHAHIAYDSLLVDQDGRIRLAGFGAHRSAILRDNPGLTPNDDAFDIGLLVYELIFGVQPPESLEIPESSPYSSRITDLISLAFSHPHPMKLHDRALAAGAEPLAPVVNTSKEETSSTPVSETIQKATERNVDNLVTGVDIASSFAALLNDLTSDAGNVAKMVFKALFKKPVSKDPLCAMRLLTMLHNLILDGPEGVLEAVRKNDKFMDWVESSWTREAVESSSSEQKHPSRFSFAGGELAFYSAFLRRKAKFHLLAAGGFTGRWDRTGAINADGRDVLVTRRRKVISGMADVIEMASELGCRFAAARDPDAPVKQAALGALVSECCLAFKAGEELAFEVDTVAGVRKLEEGIGRLYKASRELVFAVEHVPSAGGEEWVEHFASQTAPDIVEVAKNKELRAQELVDEAVRAQDEAIQQKRERKAEKRRRREEKERKKAEKQKAKEEKEKELSAADGALVVHGADEASKAITTMFGDLLALDGQPSDTGNTDVHSISAAAPGLSNAQALASAFGVPEEAVGTQYGGLSDPNYEHDNGDDDDDSAYNDYQARKNQRPQHSSGPRQGSLTAAWAARAMAHQAERSDFGSSSQAEVKYNRRPTALQTRLRGSPKKLDSVSQEAHPSRKAEGASYYYDDADSLDEAENARYGSLGGAGHQSRANQDNPYHSDDGDCDSYESVSYSVEEQRPGAGFPVPSNPDLTGAVRMAVENDQGPKHPGFFVPDKKRILNMKKLRLGEKISETANIIVYKGEYNREPVAIKKLSKAGLQSEDAKEELANEVKILCSLSHPRILACVASCLEKPNFIFVTEFMKRGTLFDILHKKRIKLTWSLVRKISLQIAEAMCHVHEAGVLHRDLKSLNVFVDNSFNIKIGDFGLARSARDNVDDGISGTYQYMAPEIIRGEPHSEKSDVYAYAVLVCEMISGVPPFHNMEARQVAERIVQEDIRPSIPANCQRAYVNLIQMCWGTVPSTRPAFSEIIGLITSTTK